MHSCILPTVAIINPHERSSTVPTEMPCHKVRILMLPKERCAVGGRERVGEVSNRSGG